MEIQKTTGIALSARIAGEADIICTYYTPDCGKRSFVFKGLRKSRRRARAATEPGVIASLVYYHRDGRDSCIAREADVVHYHPSLSTDLMKIFHLCFILEAVEKTCGYLIADDVIYRLLASSIDALAVTGHPAHLSCFFIIRLLRGHGIMHETLTCKSCGRAIAGAFTLDVSDCRPVCDRCISAHRSGPRHRGPAIARPMAEYVRSCVSGQFDAIRHERFAANDILDLLYSLTLFLEQYFRTDLKSKSFILSNRYQLNPPVEIKSIEH